jgi:GNAT superfamily N-acetyltransferase
MKTYAPSDPTLPSKATEAFAQGAARWLEAGTAHAALWFEALPSVPDRTVGALGSFHSDSPEAAQALLDHAEALFRQQNIDYVLGPMNGNTWRSHRLVIESSGRPPFLFEPRNPAEYLGYFETAGYEILSRYSSGLIDLNGNRPDFTKLETKLTSRGIHTRPLDPTRFTEDLSAIFEVSLASFGNNFLYTPLEKEEFFALYTKAREHLVPEFVRLSFIEDQVVGFVFAVPDLEAAQRGDKPAIVVKTLAVLPERRLAGLGSLLVDQVQQAAKARGFTEAIHALQHETNSSLRVSGRFEATVFRRYALFAKDLT